MKKIYVIIYFQSMIILKLYFSRKSYDLKSYLINILPKAVETFFLDISLEDLICINKKISTKKSLCKLISPIPRIYADRKKIILKRIGDQAFHKNRQSLRVNTF